MLSFRFKKQTSKNLADTTFKRNNDKTCMDIYYKSTDTHRCLPFSSNHPNHYKKNITFTLARRICTIVEDAEAKKRHLENLKNELQKISIPKTIECGIKKALSISL